MKIKLFDVVKMLRDIGKVKAGAIGTIVDVWKESELYEVEIVDKAGETVDCLTVKPADFALLTKKEIADLE